MTKSTESETQQFYSGLTKVLSKIHQARSFEQAYPLVEKALLALFHAQRMTVYQRNRSSKDIVSRFKTGDDLTEIRVPVSAGSIAGYVALSRQPLIIADVHNAEELKRSIRNCALTVLLKKISSLKAGQCWCCRFCLTKYCWV